MPGRRVSYLLIVELVFLLASLNGVRGLKGMAIRVPEAVVAGDTVKMSCEYDLEQAALYTIKWYWDEQEFYRFVPKESPAYKIFPLDGINVDEDQSDSREVTLRNVQRDLTGFYKCEVSADAPLFHTDIKTAAMIVADLPSDNPTLTTEKVKYSLGEKIRANCSTGPSYPAANITWFVNGQQVSSLSPQTRITVVLLPEADGLDESRSSLELEASSVMFRDGKLRLRCLATLYTLYRRTEEVELVEDTPQLQPVMGPTAPHNHESVNASPCSQLSTPFLYCVAVLLVAASTR